MAKESPSSNFQLNVPFTIVRDLRRPVFEYSVPTYLVTADFRLIDWNIAFYDLIAKPLGIAMGSHIQNFVGAYSDKQHDYYRRPQMASTGDSPRFFHETITINHPEFGKLEFEKLATQLFDFNGHELAWIVQLSPRQLERPAEFYARLARNFEWQVQETLFSAALEQEFLNPEELHQKVQHQLARLVKTEKIFVPGIGNGLIKPPRFEGFKELIATEFNHSMNEVASKRMGANLHQVVTARRQAVDDFTGVAKAYYDVVLVFDAIQRSSNYAEMLKNCRQLLNKEGALLLFVINPDENPWISRFKAQKTPFNFPSADEILKVLANENPKSIAFEASMDKKIGSILARF